MLTDLIAAYDSRLQSYEFLLARIEQEMAFAQNPEFLRFCECETKRLQDLIQLCRQVQADLNGLERSAGINDDDDADGNQITLE